MLWAPKQLCDVLHAGEGEVYTFTSRGDCGDNWAVRTYTGDVGVSTGDGANTVEELTDATDSGECKDGDIMYEPGVDDNEEGEVGKHVLIKDDVGDNATSPRRVFNCSVSLLSDGKQKDDLSEDSDEVSGTTCNCWQSSWWLLI